MSAIIAHYVDSFSTFGLTFSASGDILNVVLKFTYLDCMLTSSSDITDEIKQRIKIASAAFGRLSKRIFFNHNLTVSTKVAVYKAVCVSTLLHGCEG